MRRVIQGYANKPGHTLAQGGEFAYLQLDKIEGADVALDATAAHAAALLQLRHAASTPVAVTQEPLQLIARGPDWLLVLCTQTGAAVMEALRQLPTQQGVARLVVVAPRPKAVALWLGERGVQAQTLSLREALTLGQDGRKTRAIA
jgi:adenine-specific DNA-methyltransferase